jgi:hypothetical protein
MKFETIYKNTKSKIQRELFSDDYSFELFFYNEFSQSLTTNESFIKSWRWNVQQNAGMSVHEGRVHIKTMLRQVFDANTINA